MRTPEGIFQSLRRKPTYHSGLRASKDLGNVTPDDIFDAVHATQEKVHGAYAVVSIIANHGLLAFCDPNGIRPLILGKKEMLLDKRNRNLPAARLIRYTK